MITCSQLCVPILVGTKLSREYVLTSLGEKDDMIQIPYAGAKRSLMYTIVLY